MMAVRAPLGLSPSSNALFAAFSPFPDHPESPRPASATAARSNMSATYQQSGLRASQQPTSATSITSPASATVTPSPIHSEAGTEFENVDDEELQEDEVQTTKSSSPPPTQPVRPVQPSPAQYSPGEARRGGPPHRPGLGKLSLNTGNALALAVQNQQEDIEPQSVIHAPAGFGKFETKSTLPPPPPAQPQRETNSTAPPEKVPPESERPRADSADSYRSDNTVTINVRESNPHQKQPHEHPMPPTPLQTTLPLTQDWSSTPRAQTRSDLGAFSRPGSSLDSILEGEDIHDYAEFSTGEDSDGLPGLHIRSVEDEIAALRAALSECWTLCNTLAGLSYIHRQKMFGVSGAGDMEQTAWKSCWKLCQNLYDTQEGKISTSARPTLDLCREFCQALFDVRVRDNETADSVLRVSFELNNHLFNTHDRNLPEAFRERTLDFYITLCHRLMKQKARMAQETDSLLRACWSLAEMLFNLRQKIRENKTPDEELLGSAVQACWELCDLFREGWTQIRPERGTPRPSQPTFSQAYYQAKRSGFAPVDENGNPKPLPETPTTLFEETINMISPDDPPPQPNILVLGAQANLEARSTMSTGSSVQPNQALQRGPMSAHPTTRRHWPSISSTQSQSTASDSFNPISAASTATAKTQPQPSPREDVALILLRTLFVKAALSTNRGYTRTSSDPNLNSLTNFVRNLPDTAFGTQVWQVSLLENYQKAVTSDSSFKSLGTSGIIGERGRVNPVEVARAVKGMVSCVYGFGWLRDLYRYVFGYYVEEALKGEGGSKSDSGSDKGGVVKIVQRQQGGMGSGNGNGRRSQSVGVEQRQRPLSQ